MEFQLKNSRDEDCLSYAERTHLDKVIHKVRARCVKAHTKNQPQMWHRTMEYGWAKKRRLLHIIIVKVGF